MRSPLYRQSSTAHSASPAGTWARKIVRYSLVSLISIAISQSVLMVAFGILHWTASLSNIVACAVATVPSYYLNRTWTWGRRGTSRLWGEVVPVPEDRVISLADGETQEAAGHVLSVLFSPGHASHHVAYWDPDLSAVFTGDVGGVRMPGADYALPPAPPPDLAPEDWAISTERLRQAGPRRLYLTHGGPFDDVSAHLEQLMPNLAEVEEICRAAMLGGADDEAVTNLLQAHTERRIGAAVAEDAGIIERYGWASPSVLSALGFRRLLSRRGDIPRRDRAAG